MTFIPCMMSSIFHVDQFFWFRSFGFQKPKIQLTLFWLCFCHTFLFRPTFANMSTWVLFLSSRSTTFMFCILSNSMYFELYRQNYQNYFNWIYLNFNLIFGFLSDVWSLFIRRLILFIRRLITVHQTPTVEQTPCSNWHRFGTAESQFCFDSFGT